MLWKSSILAAAICVAIPLQGSACQDDGSMPGSFPFQDSGAVASFITTLKADVAHSDRKAIADLIAFPLLTSLHGKPTRVNKASFLAHYTEIFNEKVRTAILEGEFLSPDNYRCVFWNAQGLMFGNGEVWINEYRNQEIRIITVNN